jgi:hypothetical protein
MAITICCPNCSTAFPLGAGFTDEDGKLLAQFFAGLEPPLAKAIFGYCRLWKPAKTRLTNARALKIASEVHALVCANVVHRDHQAYATIPQDWIDAMLKLDANPPRKLPLDNHDHGYLREAVVTAVLKRKDREEKAAYDERKQLDVDVAQREQTRRTPTGNSGLTHISDDFAGRLKPKQSSEQERENAANLIAAIKEKMKAVES